jgi:hypothetical protein
MSTHQIHFGRKFYRCQGDVYYYTSSRPKIYAHRWVWMQHHGEIPEGYHVHHKDGDTSNNSYENLQLLQKSDHQKQHWNDPEKRAKRRKFLDEIRTLAHEKMRTPKIKEKTRKSMKEAWKSRPLCKINCVRCGKEVETPQKWRKFCDSSCRKEWRFSNGISHEEKICAWCQCKFFARKKILSQKFCSISCCSKNSRKTIREKPHLQ